MSKKAIIWTVVIVVVIIAIYYGYKWYQKKNAVKIATINTPGKPNTNSTPGFVPPSQGGSAVPVGTLGFNSPVVARMVKGIVIGNPKGKACVNAQNSGQCSGVGGPGGTCTAIQSAAGCYEVGW